MFIAIPNTIMEKVTGISPAHWRVQAALIQNNYSNIMIVNSYFPQDSKSPIHIDPELEEVIAVINNLLMNTVYHYQIRKCRKAVETLKWDKLLYACINGEGDIFH